LAQKRGLGSRLGRIERAVSQKKHRAARPSDGIIDSQRVKTQYDTDGQGIDGGKKVKGRKRPMVVDIQGNLLQVQVHAANLHDPLGGYDVLRRAAEKHPNLKVFSGDAGVTRHRGALRGGAIGIDPPHF
jgi:hypothetical protein